VAPAVLFLGLLLGLARAASPGLANAESIRLGAVRGRARDAVLVQLGALAGDLGWVVLALFGLGMMLQDPGLHRVLAVVGGLLLAGNGLGAIRAALTETGEPEIDPSGRRPGTGPFGTGASFSGTRVLSPVLWLGIGGWLAPRLPVAGELAAQATFVIVFAAGWLAWALVQGALLLRVPGRVVTGFVRAMDGFAGLALLGLGLAVVAGTLPA
jgi:threonine/homoserine/homoserine lactone efflux protein